MTGGGYLVLVGVSREEAKVTQRADRGVFIALTMGASGEFDWEFDWAFDRGVFTVYPTVGAT